MESGYALELKSHLNIEINILEDCYYKIYQYEPVDETEAMFVFTDQTDINALHDQLIEWNVIEEIHALLLFEDGTISRKFYDYGWRGKSYYLYRDLVQPFRIIDGEEIQKKMAVLQIQEDIIAYNNKEQIFFVDHQLKDLIKGYANAYNITVEYL